ncbi:PREDICTED: protein 5NUC-like [Diuraphis noxia]|uniref:protein 5NUC-like n=1 Tax=Diuraphis noxia TaxID=143948 RepID=UPI0007636FE7|nr:PREDICTED: protein 5NUC-like [Diuraphis noxia]
MAVNLQFLRMFRIVVLFLLLQSTVATHYRLLVLHTNDMHSRFDQIDATGAECVEAGQPCYGGFARLKTAVDQERRLADAGTADGALFLNAGDTFQGTAFYTLLKWRAVERMVRTLGIDVMCLGNHEFDDGVEDLAMFIRNITIPVVACNLDLTNEPSLANEPNLMKSKVLTVNGRKIGIIGYLTPETAAITRVGNVKIMPEIPSIVAEAKRLKNRGVDILIALGHSGIEMDTQIARDVEDIDLVIGGHSHTFLYTGNPPDIDKPFGSYPLWVKQPNSKRKVPVIHAYYVTKYLGELWLDFDEIGEIIKCHGNPILLDSSIGQDTEVLNEVKIMNKVIEVKTKQVIGSTSVFLEGINEYCRFRECNLGNFITDSFIDYNIRNNIKSFDSTKSWTDAPIALLQAGGIRTNMNNINKRGNITFGDLLSSLPFQDDIGKITTKGSDIWTAFEYSVRRYSKTVANGEFLQVSGLNVVIDFGRPSGDRVQSIYARCGNCVVPMYEKLDLNANYTIIISNYLSEGGDGFSFNKVIKYQSFGKSDLDIVEEQFHARSPIWPEVGQRIVLLRAEELNKMQTTSRNVQFIYTPLSNFIIFLLVIAIMLYLPDQALVNGGI